MPKMDSESEAEKMESSFEKESESGGLSTLFALSESGCWPFTKKASAMIQNVRALVLLKLGNIP